MFAPGELHTDDPKLVAAQQQAIGSLTTAVGQLAGTDATPTDGPSKLALISWALVHGLVVLTRDGALRAADTSPATDSTALAHTLADLFTHYVGAQLANGKISDDWIPLHNDLSSHLRTSAAADSQRGHEAPG